MKAVPKSVSTLFLKAAIIVIGAAVFALCAFVFPQLWIVGFRELPELTSLLYPALIGFFATAVPFFFALYQAFKLLQYIDANNAFSDASVQALKRIKYSAVAMSGLYAMAMPLVVVFMEQDDAPGGILMGMAIVCAPLIVATFAAVLEKLVRSAITLKTENDLTV